MTRCKQWNVSNDVHKSPIYTANKKIRNWWREDLCVSEQRGGRCKRGGVAADFKRAKEGHHAAEAQEALHGLCGRGHTGLGLVAQPVNGSRKTETDYF